MSNPKRKLQAKPFISDFRSGMGDEQLMEKYSLSPIQLEKAFRKLVDLGAIAEMEFLMRTSISDSIITKAFVDTEQFSKDVESPSHIDVTEHVAQDSESLAQIEITEKVTTPTGIFGRFFSKLTGTG